MHPSQVVKGNRDAPIKCPTFPIKQELRTHGTAYELTELADAEAPGYLLRGVGNVSEVQRECEVGCYIPEIKCEDCVEIAPCDRCATESQCRIAGTARYLDGLEVTEV